MRTGDSGDEFHGERPLPTVTIVFLVHNRREQLRESLCRMVNDSDYPADRVDLIVVDNASQDGSADMVRDDFPAVRLIRREVNCGVSGWNDGFAVARGEFVLALDDDCYLPADGLRRAVEGAREHHADLVSFAVSSSDDPDYRFNERYRTGLLSFWGCAVLVRRPVLEALGGYDPEIFVWANELEFMLRFYDAGYRHLHCPEIVAVHMKETGGHWTGYVLSPAYLFNARHFAYIAAKLLRPRDAAEALVALLTVNLRDALRADRSALKGLPATLAGFRHGLRHRSPVANPAVSMTYRRNFESFASPWWLSRPPLVFMAAMPKAAARRLLRRPRRVGSRPGRKREFYAQRTAYFPERAATLQM